MSNCLVTRKFSLSFFLCVVMILVFTTFAYANARTYHGLTTVGYGTASIHEGGSYWDATRVEYTTQPFYYMDQIGASFWSSWNTCNGATNWSSYQGHSYSWYMSYNARSSGDSLALEDVECPGTGNSLGRVSSVNHWWQSTGFSGDGEIIAKPSAISTTFYDVPTTYWAYSFIESMYQIGILDPDAVSNHCWSGFFCPGDWITRAQMASYLERGMHGSNYEFPAPSGIFSDVPLDYWNISAIEKLYADQVTGGCGLNPLRYCPEKRVTRAEMAVFLLRAEHGNTYYPPPVGSSTGFTDVSTTYWAAAWIKQLAAEGITGGCLSSPPKFCPEAPTSHAQMAVFLQRTFAP